MHINTLRELVLEVEGRFKITLQPTEELQNYFNHAWMVSGFPSVNHATDPEHLVQIMC